MFSDYLDAMKDVRFQMCVRQDDGELIADVDELMELCAATVKGENDGASTTLMSNRPIDACFRCCVDDSITRKLFGRKPRTSNVLNQRVTRAADSVQELNHLSVKRRISCWSSERLRG